MPDDAPDSEPDPQRSAADKEVEETAAVARGEIPTRPNAADVAAADAELAETLQESPPVGAGAPLASVGDADTGAETIRQAPSNSGGPQASLGDADTGAETIRQPPAPSPPMALSADEKTWATVAHAAAVATFGLPLGNILGPLGIWLYKKDSSDWVATHALAALNFQITMTLAAIIATASMFAIVGFILLPAVVIADVVYTIRALIHANDGGAPNYPDWSLTLVKG